MNEFKHQGKDKKKFVKYIFNDISKSYDFLNHFLSLGIDIVWRKKFINTLSIKENDKILDVATGTGDVAFTIRKNFNVSITGLDLSKNMLDIAERKAKKFDMTDIDFIEGDAEEIPFEDNTFDILVISYGLRNLGNYNKGISEFRRVLKEDGELGILEFFEPRSTFVSKIFKFYFNKILPRIASFFSNSKAYRYLPESVQNFKSHKELEKNLKEAGFNNISIKNLTFGITSIINAKK